jgi:murein DD-endopeptidase MepM/ murein hydrolase activator NlpD
VPKRYFSALPAKQKKNVLTDIQIDTSPISAAVPQEHTFKTVDGGNIGQGLNEIFPWLPIPLSTRHKYTLNSVYGPRWESFHFGVDIAAKINTPILSPCNGTVICGRDVQFESIEDLISDHGEDYVIVKEDGEELYHLLGHNNAKVVENGQKVVAGQVIALVGDLGLTGPPVSLAEPHVHWEIMNINSYGVDNTTIDPAVWIQNKPCPRYRYAIVKVEDSNSTPMYYGNTDGWTNHLEHARVFPDKKLAEQFMKGMFFTLPKFWGISVKQI